MSPRRIRVVAALIRDPDAPGRYLVQQRLPGASRANQWEFPGGKVEPGESDAQAVVRECREELGIEVVAGRRVHGSVHAYADLVVELELWSATVRSGTPTPLDAQALRFGSPDELRALDLCEADVPLVEALQRGLET